jgi:hypothetical protein
MAPGRLRSHRRPDRNREETRRPAPCAAPHCAAGSSDRFSHPCPTEPDNADRIPGPLAPGFFERRPGSRLGARPHLPCTPPGRDLMPRVTWVECLATVRADAPIPPRRRFGSAFREHTTGSSPSEHPRLQSIGSSTCRNPAIRDHAPHGSGGGLRLADSRCVCCPDDSVSRFFRALVGAEDWRRSARKCVPGRPGLRDNRPTGAAGIVRMGIIPKDVGHLAVEDLRAWDNGLTKSERLTHCG